MSTSPTIVYRDPKSLTPHPINRSIPRFIQGMPEWLALYDDIAERGIRKPLEIHGRHVVNGETRRGIAVAMGITEVPCIEIPEDQVLAAINEQLVGQKHLTKGQRAYLLVPIAGKILAEAATRRVANLKRGQSPMPTQSASGNIGDFCENHGFSRDLFSQAETLHKIWAGDPETLRLRQLVGADVAALREEWEPKILALDAPVGLGAALAGMAGERATKDRPKAPNAEVQLDLFAQGVGTLDRVAKAWPKLRKGSRPEIVQAWTRVASAWPADLRRELAEALLRGIEGIQ